MQKIGFKKAIFRWIPFAVLTTFVFGVMYIAVQQVYRQSANDPQIQIAEDAATMLSHNANPASLVPTTKVSIDSSLSPFIVIYNASGSPLVGSGELNGQLPELPSGVFADTKKEISGMAKHETRFTWQPQNGVREAAVLTYYSYPVQQKSGFVLVGRNLREIEQREINLEELLGTAWLLTLIILFGKLYWEEQFMTKFISEK